jgi:hypothetical protein
VSGLHSLWDTPNEWISDPVGYVFLPRAMLEIGRAHYPNEWTGDEPITRGFLSLPERSALASQQVKEDVHKVLCKERPDFVRPPLTELPRVPRPISLSATPPRRVEGPPIVTFTDAEWEAAREIYQKRYDAALPAWQRHAKVCETVASGCRSGEFVAALRPKDGGDVVKMPPCWWNTDTLTLTYRFEFFSLDPRRPFLKAISERCAWICVSRDSLERFLGLLRSSHESTIKGESDAKVFLTSRLKQDPDLKRADAEAECETFQISQRGFRDRVWPKAREGAGLPARAPAGRKKS